MPARTTIELPESLHERLKERAQVSGVSIPSLVVRAVEQTYAEPKITRAVEQTYAEPKKGRPVTGPMITGTGKRGPLFPVDENPHDLILP
jgi:predicted transcriptional regulator